MNTAFQQAVLKAEFENLKHVVAIKFTRNSRLYGNVEMLGASALRKPTARAILGRTQEEG